MKLASATFLILTTLLFACNNNGNEPDDNPIVKGYDTIRPNAYLPYYPNSWWLYQVNDTGYTISKTSEDYHLVTYQDRILWRSDTVMLPIFEDYNLPVHGYNYIAINPMTGYHELVSIFSEKVGEEYHFIRLCDSRWDYGCYWQKTTGKFKCGEDSVITTEVYYSSYEGNYIDSIKFYITVKKDIGITEYYMVDTVSQDTLYKKVLIDYFINKN
jgi:hypothetical protein